MPAIEFIGCEYLFPTQTVKYPCKWTKSIVPNEARVHLVFGSKVVNLSAPLGSIDSSASTIKLDVIAQCGHEYLLGLPGETDTLTRGLRVDKSLISM